MSALDVVLPMIGTQEGFSEKPYKDAHGRWTIGFGFTYIGNTPVGPKTPPMPYQRAVMYRQALVEGLIDEVRALVQVPASENQIAALTDFAYNEGINALRHSTLLRLFNAGDTMGAAEEFGKWVYSGGKKLDALVRRREAEKTLFLTADNTQQA